MESQLGPTEEDSVGITTHGPDPPGRSSRFRPIAVLLTAIVILSLVASLVISRLELSQLSSRLGETCQNSRLDTGGTLHSMGEAVRARRYDLYSERESRLARTLGLLRSCSLSADESRLVQEIGWISRFGRSISSGLWEDSDGLDVFDVGLRDIGNSTFGIWRTGVALERTQELVDDLRALGYSEELGPGP